MWYLTADNDDRLIYVIPAAEQIIIGRSVDNQVCNFAIPDDASISRKHATLTAVDNGIILQDLGSRYGTFINGSTDKVAANINIQLKEHDIVKFGKMNSVWKVNTVHLNTCTSTLKGENLQNLKSTLSKIGGLLKNEWDDTCNYLTMPAITLTIKVVLALVEGAHIVTPEFWVKFLESVNKCSAMPNPQAFKPTVIESTLNKEVVSFLPNDKRKEIFQDKKFVFFSRRQCEMYKPVLTRGGATPLLLGECKMTVSMLCADNVIVIQYTPVGTTQETQSQRSQINDIITQLKSKGKRVIADAEIGLAVLYCSLEKYCNPNFSFTSEVVKQNPGALTKPSKVLAQESQDISAMKHQKENVKINETYGSDDKNNLDFNIDKQTAKRKLGAFTSEVQLNPNKKVATSNNATNITNESSKRKLTDDEISNPSKKVALEKNNHDQASNSPGDVLANNSDDIFNFINPANNTHQENKAKKLNLTKPHKRKFDATREDDLFNFVKTDNDNSSEADVSKQSIFNPHKIQKSDDTDIPIAPIVRHNITVTPEDISAMRGVKLKELMQSTMSFKEEPTEAEDLEVKMGALDLGNTVVITCTDLIVKKEPFKTEPEDSIGLVKNFKKFKKVWPIKRQPNIIPSSTMIAADLTDSNTYSVAF